MAVDSDVEYGIRDCCRFYARAPHCLSGLFVRPKMRFARYRWFCITPAVVGLYVGSYAAIKFSRPEFLTSNDGPGRGYCTVYYPLRFLAASARDGYWGSHAKGHWQTVKIVWNNPGNGYLEFETIDGLSGRVSAGSDLHGAKKGDVVDIHLGYVLQTWDDFSDHLMPGIDAVRSKSIQSLTMPDSEKRTVDSP